MTLLEKINNLTWWNEINKLKDILKSLLTYSNLYSSYSGLLTQSSTNSPTVTILNNSTGQTIVWSYSDVGEYIGTFSDKIKEDKIWFSVTSSSKSAIFIAVSYNTENTILLNTYSRTGSATNNALSNSSIEIRIYN